MRDSISTNMRYTEKIITLVGDGHRTKAVLFNYSYASFTLVSLSYSVFRMSQYLYDKYNKEGLSAAFKSFKTYTNVMYHYIKYLSFLILLSPFIYVSAPKVLANQIAATFELLSGGLDIDKMSEKYKDEIQEDISVKELEKTIRNMINDRKKKRKEAVA